MEIYLPKDIRTNPAYLAPGQRPVMVAWSHKKKLWRAEFYARGKVYFAGFHPTKEEALRAAQTSPIKSLREKF